MTEAADNSEQDPLARFDTTVPQSARIWNYWLGGKDNYEVDRVAGDAFREIFPGIETGAGPPATSSPAPSGIWPPRRASDSSWTSAPDCPAWTTPTR